MKILMPAVCLAFIYAICWVPFLYPYVTPNVLFLFILSVVGTIVSAISCFYYWVEK